MLRLWKLSRIVLVFLVVFVLLCGNAFAGAESMYQNAKEQLKSFEKNKKNKTRRDLWMRQIDNFDSIVKKYPNDKRACDSLYNIGMLYKGMSEVSLIQSDRRQAAESFEKLAARCGSTSLGDDGLYWAAVMYVRLHDEKRAIVVARRLLKRFENGDMRTKAKVLLKGLGASEKGDSQATGQATAKATAEKNDEKKVDVSNIDIENAKIIAPAKDSAELISVTSVKEKDKTSVTLSFSRLSAMTSGEIPAGMDKPRRIYFDFQDTVLSSKVKEEYGLKNELVDVVRVAAYSADVVRVVLELSARSGKFTLENTISPPTTTINIHYGKTLNNNNQGIEKIDKSVDTIIEEKLDSKNKTNAAITKKEIKKAAEKKYENASPDVFNVRTVVIDPGHGGDDQGARGPKGTLEKDIVLAISKRLKKQLEGQGLKVVLTRKNDRTMTLFERTEIANDLNADIFVSIHCNGNRKSKFKGVETFYLNNSSDTYSTRLAKRENESMGQQVSDLDFILTDLSMNANVNDSIALANFVQKSMVKKLKLKYSGIEDRGVRRAVFHVLLYARMPAILVETSFITNAKEEKRLKSAKYQEQLAKGIALGIKQYAARMKKLKKKF